MGSRATAPTGAASPGSCASGPSSRAWPGPLAYGAAASHLCARAVSALSRAQ
jgi:hypothetical protein